MKKRLFWTNVLFLTAVLATAQTVVKMEMPPQARERLQAETLFEENVPEDIPVVLDLSGFDIRGGVPPYRYQWFLNNEVISQDEQASFVPQQGDVLVLRVTDGNRCHATVSLGLKISVSPWGGSKKVSAGEILIYPTVVTGLLHIRLPSHSEGKGKIYIHNLQGRIVMERTMDGEEAWRIDLPEGIYIITVESGELHRTEKIVIR